MTPLLTPFVAVGRKLPGKIGGLCRKAFGSSWYEPEMGECGFEYCKYNLEESIIRTEGF